MQRHVCDLTSSPESPARPAAPQVGQVKVEPVADAQPLPYVKPEVPEPLQSLPYVKAEGVEPSAAPSHVKPEPLQTPEASEKRLPAPGASIDSVETPPEPQAEPGVMIMGYNVMFPAGKKPFPAQLAVMNKVLLALKTSQHALLESPTGSGKTLALLCASLTFQKQLLIEMKAEAKEKAKLKAQAEAAKRAADMEMKEKVAVAAAVRASSRSSVKSEYNGGDDDDFASTQPSFDQFRFNPRAELPGDGWISMEDKRHVKAESEAPAKRRVLPSSFQRAAVDAVGSGASLDDFHSTPADDSLPKDDGPRAPVIYFCSRTHSQLTQVVEELRNCPVSYLSACGAGSNESLKTCVLASKSKMCVNTKANRKPAEVDDKCATLLDEDKCTFFKKRKRTNDLRRVAPPVWDIEEITELGKKHRECAFFHSRDALENANIVFCPYNYMLDPSIRRSVSISLKNAIVILDEAHNVEDTCRSSASLELTADLLGATISAFAHVIKYGNRPPYYNGLLKILNGLQRWMKSIETVSSTLLRPTGFEEESKVWSGADAVAMLAEFAGLTPETLEEAKRAVSAVVEFEKEERAAGSGNDIDDGQDDGPSQATNNDRPRGKRPLLGNMALSTMQSILTIVNYMFCEEFKYLDDYKLLMIKSRARRNDSNQRFRSSYSQPGNDGWEYKMCLWCLNAAVAFADLVKQARSVVLTSGTLSPMDSFAGELGTDFPIRLEANHVVDMRRQVLIGAVMNGPGGVDLMSTYKNQQEFRYQDSLGELLLQYTQVVPGGILMFFPSYHLMDKLATRWQETGVWAKINALKTVFQEPRQAGKEFDALLEQYRLVILQTAAATATAGDSKAMVKAENGSPALTGAIFLAVYRGKVSEGIDFANANARAVLVVGIPYPNVRELQVELKRKYQDEKSRVDRKLVNGHFWYQLQAFRALNQALGRCIRHRQDYGMILLLDSRHRMQAHVRSLSKWTRPFIQEFEHSQQSLPLVPAFFERNLQALGNPVKGATSATEALAAREPMVLNYESSSRGATTNARSTSQAGRTMDGAMQSVKAYMAKRQLEMNPPRVFSLFAPKPSGDKDQKKQKTPRKY